MTTQSSSGAPSMALLIDTLLPDAAPTVIADEGAPKSWAPMPRIGGNRRVTERIRAIITGVRTTARPVDVLVGPRASHRLRVTATPLVGPSGNVHAVWLWAGEPDAPPPVPRSAAAFEWSSTSRLITLGRKLTNDEAEPAIAGRLTLTAPEVFRYITQLDDAMTLIAKALEPVPEDRWEGIATLDTPHGQRTVHLGMRSMPAPAQQCWRGVLHDVTDTVKPAPLTLHALAHSALTARGGPSALALMDLRQARIVSWLTDPVPGIAWKGVVDNRDTPPPEDVVRIFQAFGQLRDGAEQVHIPSVRLRRLAGGWTTVDAHCTIVPGTKPLVAVVELTPIPLNSQGRPSQAIGRDRAGR